MMSASKASANRAANSENVKAEKRKRADDEFDSAISNDFKGIMSTLQKIKEEAQKKNEETISSVASEIKSGLDEMKAKPEEGLNFVKVLSKSSKECENLLKNATAEIQEVYDKLTKEKPDHLQALKDVIVKHEEEKERLFTCYEQIRKKGNTMLLSDDDKSTMLTCIFLGTIILAWLKNLYMIIASDGRVSCTLNNRRWVIRDNEDKTREICPGLSMASSGEYANMVCLLMILRPLFRSNPPISVFSVVRALVHLLNDPNLNLPGPCTYIIAGLTRCEGLVALKVRKDEAGNISLIRDFLVTGGSEVNILGTLLVRFWVFMIVISVVTFIK